MSGKERPGVVLVTKFALPEDSVFKSYIDYMDRSSATRAAHAESFVMPKLMRELSFAGYPFGYMDDGNKLGEIFTAKNDTLSPEEIKYYKQKFQDAQNNKSLMWQSIISFDNAFLQEYGLFDPETKYLDESKIREVTRNCMKKMLVKEHLDPTAVYTAAIHYNTDNIHVHIATVEPVPTRETATLKFITFPASFVAEHKVLENVGPYRTGTSSKVTATKGGYGDIFRNLCSALNEEGIALHFGSYVTVLPDKSVRMSYRGTKDEVPSFAIYSETTVERGKFRKASIAAGKSAAVNTIVEQSVDKRRINEIIRDNITGGMRVNPLYSDPELSSMFLELVHTLPSDRRLWKYNNNAMEPFRPAIDAISNKFIDTKYKEQFEELNRELSLTQDIFERAYGGEKNNYKDNKLKELYSSLGNTILKSASEYVRSQNRTEREPGARKGGRRIRRGCSNVHIRALSSASEISAALYHLERSMSSDYVSFRNQLIYERLEAEAERGENEFEYDD